MKTFIAESTKDAQRSVAACGSGRVSSLAKNPPGLSRLLLTFSLRLYGEGLFACYSTVNLRFKVTGVKRDEG